MRSAVAVAFDVKCDDVLHGRIDPLFQDGQLLGRQRIAHHHKTVSIEDPNGSFDLRRIEHLKASDAYTACAAAGGATASGGRSRDQLTRPERILATKRNVRRTAKYVTAL